MSKDWTGNKKTQFATLGASNHSEGEREGNDYYATDPKAMELLLELECFSQRIWEPACGEGHLSKVLEAKGHKVISSDLIPRGYGSGGVDFLSCTKTWKGDIITNPPFKYAKEFVEKGIELLGDKGKLALFLRVQFLETSDRKSLFEKYPPKTIYVSSGRILCAKNGEFEREGKRMSSAACYAWFIWEKGFTGDTTLKWFN